MAVAVLLCWVLALMRPAAGRRVRAACVFAALMIALLPIDVLSGQNPIWRQDVSLLSGRVTRSPVLTLAVRAMAARRTEWRARNAENAPMDSASAQLTPWLGPLGGSATRPNVVLIVVESWGLLLDPHLAQALTAPYAEPGIARSYRVTYGTAPFSGLTVPGEARELCRSTMGFGILHPSPEITEQCLPGEFHALGYRNIALHGYTGEMFYRAAWYRALGFDRTWFGPELQHTGLPRCEGAFPGICDGAMARFIGDSLGGSQLDARDARPQFIYWVTLNSHLPVPARPELPADDACGADPALRNSAALCSWFRLVRAVHASVSQVAAQTTAHPTIFILVGDHAPPFASPRLRSQFSASQVPYVMLTPASLQQR
jgi:phosphoglycerol transferase MdoB-like AlkP superfamily enzyme